MNGAKLPRSHLMGEEEGVCPAWGCSLTLALKVFLKGGGAQGSCTAKMQGAGWPQGQHWRPQSLGKAAPPALPVTVLPAALQET